MNTTDNKQAGAVGYIRDDGIQELNGGRLNLALWAEPSFGVKTPVYLAPPAAVPVEALEGLVAKLNLLTRYEVSIGGGCECCGTWIEHESDKDGEWIKHGDIGAIRDELTTLIKERSNAN